jgi:hypothetical protein
MKLLLPLQLKTAKTEALNMVPTEKFFKPVLVLVAPLTKENADIIGCGYLYDPHGNPYHFQGTHRPEGELSGATIRLSALEIKTEKVCKFSVFLDEDLLHIRLRAHLPESEESTMVRLFSVLASLNKTPFDLTVTDAQGTLVPKFGGEAETAAPVEWPQAFADGSYGFDVCVKRPFSAKKLKACIYTMQTGDESFVWGWTLNCQFNKLKPVEQERRPLQVEAMPTSQSAVARSALTLAEFAVTAIECDAAAESKQFNDLIEYLADFCPDPEEIRKIAALGALAPTEVA